MTRIGLTGKRALVCGSSRGIGKAIAIQLAALGAEIVLLARSEKELKAVSQCLSTEEQQKHTYLIGDRSHLEQLQEKVKMYLASSPPIHILVNNTGGPLAGDLIATDIDTLQCGLQEHLIANHMLTQLLVKGMKETKYGRVINILSTSVKRPISGLGVSNTVRAAIANWSKTLSNELGPYGITVNNVLPGTTNTDRLHDYHQMKADKKGISLQEVMEQSCVKIPLGRFAKPEEVAYAVCFLASPMADYITGIDLAVDGGKLLFN